MPPGLRAWWSFPRPAVDEQGIAHVVWGENGDSAFTDHLWYARYGGERWGAPQLIPANHRFMWGLGTVSTLVARRDTLHLVAMGEGSNLIYLRRAHGEWTAHKVDVPLEAITGGYPSLTVLSDGRLVLVAQGPAVDTAKRSKPGGQLTSRAFATWSDDGGVSWARSVALSSSDAEPAHEFHLLQSPNGVLRAIWYQMTDSLGVPAQQSSLGGSPGRVHIAESRDRGARWRLLAPSPLLNNAYSLDAQPLDSTTLAIVLVDRAAEEVLLTTWSNEWRPFVHIKSQRDPQATLFGRDDAQRLVLTWATEQGPPRWFLSMVMTLTACT
jgi:hypothetical protein